MRDRFPGWSFVWAVGLAASLSGPAASLAQSPAPAAPEACAAMENDAARLSCYDNTLGRAPGTDADARGLLDSRWELSADSKRGVLHPRIYKPVFVSPVAWTDDTNETPRTPNPRTTATAPQDHDSVEAKFQLSFKVKLAENLFGDTVDLWGAYTQSSRWQLYNSENSRPFRETNYEPEVMLVAATGYEILGWRGRMAGLGVNHQSNGQGRPLSRSWDRAMLLIGLDRRDWALILRPWLRLDKGGDDDNPDISDYLGRGDLLLVHVLGRHQFGLTARHSLKTGSRSHGAVQFEWAFPIRGPLRGRLQVFHGYGESMIDYNHRATWVNAGFSLAEWF